MTHPPLIVPKKILRLLSGTSVDSFLSLRHMHHAIEDSVAGKSIVNLAGCSENMLVRGVHRPLDDLCGRFCDPSVRDTSFPFRVHHCSGSLENWLSCPTRKIEAWEQKNNHPVTGQDNSLSEWFCLFVELAGENTAGKLTVDACNAALNDWQAIKIGVEQDDETIPPAFQWDDPLLCPPTTAITNHSNCQVLQKQRMPMSSQN